MTTVTIDLPDTVFSALRRAPKEFVEEMRIEAATQWYAQQRISQEKGAEIAGISRAEFIDELARRRIPVVQVSLEELMEEVRGDD
jgi:predicted HTH domain antitoxin